MDPKAHWEAIYRNRAETDLSWYQPRATRSLALIRQVAPDLETPLLDVGGGASVLVDDLVAAGYRDLTVLDLSPSALAATRARLGPRAAGVHWLEADILSTTLRPGGYRVWHDRAVFHFLTNPSDQARYVAQVQRAVPPGGFVLVAGFAPEGPSRCSGLEVVRYGPEELHAVFGAPFRLLTSEREDHQTPGGNYQAFIYCLCRREGDKMALA